MYIKLFVAGLLMSGVALAANIPQASNIFSLGNSIGVNDGSMLTPADNYSSLIDINGGISSTNANNYYMLSSTTKANDSSGQYQVSTGKTLVCPGVYVHASTAGLTVQFVASSGALAAHDTATAPTGAVYKSPTSSPNTSGLWIDATGPKFYPYPVTWSASQFPSFRTATGTIGLHVWASCIEK